MTSHRSGLVARWELGRPAVRALAAVAAIVSLVAAFLAWQAQPRVEPAGVADGSGVAGPGVVGSGVVVPGVVGSGGGAGPGGVGSGGVGSVGSASGFPPGAGAASGVLLVVAVSGRVRRPGLVQLPPGARVGDAITAAGGPLPGTDLTMVNLARRVSDGELILVGVTPPPGFPVAGGPPADGGGGGPAGPGPAALVNLNAATSEQLETLPGVGPVLAERILAFRAQRGGFTSVSQLRQVSGIGDARYAELKDRVTI
jgi:competence protein ComEA